MSKTRIVILTDSTSDLGPNMLKEAKIETLPLYVMFEGQRYRDGVDLHSFELLDRMKVSGALPSTEPPSVQDFTAKYQELLLKAEEVLSIHISGGLSETVLRARKAAEAFGGRVTVLDSQAASVGLAAQALRARELSLNPSLSAGDIAKLLKQRQEKQKLLFSVGTLKFLKLNGRIGGAQAFLGRLLNLRPILCLEGGKVQAVGRQRGSARVLAYLEEQAKLYQEQHGPARVMLASSAGGDRHMQRLRPRLEALGLRVTGEVILGSTIASHAGPRTLVLFMEPEKLELQPDKLGLGLGQQAPKQPSA